MAALVQSRLNSSPLTISGFLEKFERCKCSLPPPRGPLCVWFRAPGFYACLLVFIASSTSRFTPFLPSWQFSFSYPPLFGPGNCGLWWVPHLSQSIGGFPLILRPALSILAGVFMLSSSVVTPPRSVLPGRLHATSMGGGISVFPHQMLWYALPLLAFYGMCTTSVRNQSPSWWDSKLKITWARDIVRPVVPCRPTRGRFGPPDRNLVGVIKCAFQSAMCGGDRVVRVPPASSVNVRCQFGKGGGDGPFDT
jgi:hypothetical protein